MCRNSVLWLLGRSFCRDQNKSFWLSLRSTYWHIQMPSVYCESRSIGWNNTATGDNVLEHDDLWSSFGFTDSGAFIWFPQQLQSELLCWYHILLTPPTWDCSFFFSPLLVSQKTSPFIHPLADFLTLPPHFHLFLFFNPIATTVQPPNCLSSPMTLPLSPPAARLGWLSVSPGRPWTFLIYYPKQKWHGISVRWLG